MTSAQMRIVYFIGQLGLGGSERQLYLLLKHMDGKCFERHVVVFNPSANYTLDDDLRQVGVIVHTISPDVRSIPSRAYWLYKLLISIRPDIIHSWSIHDNAYAAVIGRLIGTKVIVGSERVSLVDPDYRSVDRLFRLLILFGVHKHMVNAESIKRELIHEHVRREDIFVLPNCVERSVPSGINGNTLFNKSRIVGMVANLRRQKNYPLFIRAMDPILHEFPDVICLMIGQAVPNDPEVPDQITQEIAHCCSPERLIWLGFQRDIPAFLHQFSVFCLTSDWEGTPNAILEAMSAGLPVVATRVDGVVNIIQNGVTGIIVDPGSDEQVTAAVRNLLIHPDLAGRIGREGQDFVLRNFDCISTAEKLQDYYKGLLGQNLCL